MRADELLEFFLQFGLLLLAATILGRVAIRLGMPAIAGELFAGVLLGPSVLGQIAPGLSSWLLPEQVSERLGLDAVGTFGVLLLMGLSGMQVDLNLLKSNRLAITKISAACLLVPVVFGLGIGLLMPSVLTGGSNRLVFALFLAVALSVSAIAVIVKTLSDLGLMHRDIAQLILATAVIDNVIAWVLLSVVCAMAIAHLSVGTVLLTVFLIISVVAATIIGRKIVEVFVNSRQRPAAAEHSAGPRPILAYAVGLVMLAAAATHALKLEPVLGAFAAGIVLAALPPDRRSGLDSLHPVVNNVLAPLYFATAGLQADLTGLADRTTLAAALVVLAAAVASKFLGAYIGTKSSGRSSAEAVALGAGLNARGVIQIIIADTAYDLGIFNDSFYTIVLLTAIATSVMAAPILRFATARIAADPDDEIRRQDALPEGH